VGGHHAGFLRFDQEVGIANQPFKNLLAFCRIEIERDAALPRVVVRKRNAMLYADFSFDEGAIAADTGAFNGLNEYDIRAEIDKLLAAILTAPPDISTTRMPASAAGFVSTLTSIMLLCICLIALTFRRQFVRRYGNSFAWRCGRVRS
jgi:hypothetical protein